MGPEPLGNAFSAEYLQTVFKTRQGPVKNALLNQQLIAGIGAIIIGYLFSSKIVVSTHDIFLGFIAGFFQVGLGFIFITIGAKTTPSALVGIIMLIEAVLGPFWAWLFINEAPPLVVFIGGAIVISAVFLQFFNRKIE